jgi:hypothetical protein
MTAWIGLVGVVVGALATGGLNGWLAWLASRRDRRRTLDDAISDLQSSAHSFVISVNVSRTVPAEQRFALYQSVLVPQLGQMVRATEIIGRVSQDKRLSELADDYTDAAVSCLDPAANQTDYDHAIDRLAQSRSDFTTYCRNKRGALESAPVARPA